LSVRTQVCELLGVEHPIVQAPVGTAAVPRLAAAVSNAGALGMVALTWAADVAGVIRETAALTGRPFGGNLVLAWDQHRRLDQALEAGLRIVSFTWGDPAVYVDRAHQAGALVLHTVASAQEARRAVASGVDVVVAQGWEAGGHVWGSVATLPLVPAVVDAVAPVPVIAAGGIGDARGVAAVLALGAQAAWLGTRFLLAEETPLHEEYRRRLIAAAEPTHTGTPTCTRSAGRTLRTARSATRRPRRGSPRAARRRAAGPAKVSRSRGGPPASRSSGTPPRSRSREPPGRSRRSRCGPDKALRSRHAHSPPPTLSPSSPAACRPGSDRQTLAGGRRDGAFAALVARADLSASR
jgi:NAD(P)H-dependent flavin oxidoreductase YrpB (nitropropane dioxygenase family)